MVRRVVWSRRAERDLRSLDPQISSRIQQSVDRYAATGTGDVRALRGTRERVARLRVGNYRVIFTPEMVGGDEIIRILRVYHRRDAYR